MGEVLGFILGSAFGLSGRSTVVVAVGLAFLFGYTFSTFPLLRTGLPIGSAVSLVLAADTLSIATMEVVDNGIMALIPGAMAADLPNPLFWVSMTVALSAAFAAAFPVNRFLLQKGRGHALVHQLHHEPEAAPTEGRRRDWIPNIPTPALAFSILTFQLGGFSAALATSMSDPGRPPDTSVHSSAVVSSSRTSNEVGKALR